MKKRLSILSVLLLLTASVTMGQTPTPANTQFPNPGFEKWTNHNCSTAQGTSEVPDNWHTFDEVKYDTWPGGSLAKKTSHFKLSGQNAYRGNLSWQLATHTVNIIITVRANGTATSGRTRVGSTTVTDNSNYNYSDLSNSSQYGNGHFYWDFVGCPDSMSFYYKTNWSTASNKPLIKVYLHRGQWYDHADGAVNAIASGNGSTTSTLTNSNLIAYCQTTFAPSSTDWARFAGKFINYSNNSVNTDNDYSTIRRPQYILASFSTNETAGGGEESEAPEEEESGGEIDSEMLGDVQPESTETTQA